MSFAAARLPVPRARGIAGWCAVSVSAVLSSYWGVWGIIENFYEGWYESSVIKNLEMMMAQYLLVMLVFVVLALAAIRWPRLGAVAHGAAGLYALQFFRGSRWTAQVFTGETFPGLFLVCPP